MPRRAQSLRGDDAGAGGVRSQNQAGIHRAAVEQHGASAAGALLANLLRTDHRWIQMLAQRREQRGARFHLHGALLSVDHERHVQLAHAFGRFAAKTVRVLGERGARSCQPYAREEAAAAWVLRSVGSMIAHGRASWTTRLARENASGLNGRGFGARWPRPHLTRLRSRSL